jgi:hypothetical protein
MRTHSGLASRFHRSTGRHQSTGARIGRADCVSLLGIHKTHFFGWSAPSTQETRHVGAHARRFSALRRGGTGNELLRHAAKSHPPRLQPPRQMAEKRRRGAKNLQPLRTRFASSAFEWIEFLRLLRPLAASCWSPALAEERQEDVGQEYSGRPPAAPLPSPLRTRLPKPPRRPGGGREGVIFYPKSSCLPVWGLHAGQLKIEN